jgi:hypothetical protein
MQVSPSRPKNEESDPGQRRRLGGSVQACPAQVLADSDLFTANVTIVRH